MSRKVFIPYPDIEDKRFNIKLLNKREFNKNIIPKETKTAEEICMNTEIMAHQKFAARYINPYTQYSGALFFHGTGTGKTVLALSIAEQFKKLSPKKILILVKNDTLKDNFEKTLLGVTGPNVFKEEQYIKRSDLQKIKDGSISKEDIMTLMKAARVKIHKDYDIVSYEYLNKIDDLSNRLIIIDEIHNFRNDNARYKNFKKLLDESEKVTVTMYSATPMYDSANEIADIFNLILPKDKQLPTGQDFNNEYISDSGKLLKKKELRELLKGKVSYIGPNVKTFPKRIDIGTKKIGIFDVIECTMSEFQRKHYDSTKGEVNTAQNNARQAANFIFPNGSYGSKGMKKGDTEFVKLNKAKVLKKKYSLTDSFRKEIDTLDNLKKYSCKFAAIIEHLQNNPNGQMFIYTRFVTGGGIILLSLLFPLFGIKSYTIISGETSGVPNKIKAFNDGKIRILLGTDAVAEGVDFKNIAEVHIVNPEWNNGKMEQIIGRAIRNCSHLGNPNKTVKVFKYVAKDTIDEIMYQRITDKTLPIINIEKFLKKTAYDCVFNKNRNGIECKDDKEKGKASIKDTKEIDIDDSTYRLNTLERIDLEKKIAKLYENKLFYALNQIVRRIDKEYKKDIYAALGYMLENKSRVVYKNKEGYLIHRGEYYIFQMKGRPENLSLNRRILSSLTDGSFGSKRRSTPTSKGSLESIRKVVPIKEFVDRL